MKRPVRIDKDKLSKLGGAEFEWCDVEILVEVTSDYVGRWRDEPLPKFMLGQSDDRDRPRPRWWPDMLDRFDLPNEPLAYSLRETASEMEARRAFVDAVEAVWRFRRHRANPKKFSALGVLPIKGLGAHYDPMTDTHTGPMIRLLRYLFVAAGATSPGVHTLFHDLKALATGNERKRGKAKR